MKRLAPWRRERALKLAVKAASSPNGRMPELKWRRAEGGRSVGRSRRRHAGEPRDRSAEEALERLALEPPSLPDGEVAKLDGQLGERRGQAGLRSAA